MFGHKHQTRPVDTLRPHAEGAIGDVFINQAIDLTPLLDAARKNDSAAIDDLLHRGYSLQWIDGARFDSTLKILAQEGYHDAVMTLLASQLRRLNINKDKITNSSALSFLLKEAIRGATLGGHKKIIESIMKAYPAIDNNFRKIAINQAKVEMGKRSIEELKNLKSLHKLSLALLIRNNHKVTAIELLSLSNGTPQWKDAAIALFEGAAQNPKLDYVKFVNEIYKRFPDDAAKHRNAGLAAIGAAAGGNVKLVEELLKSTPTEDAIYRIILIKALGKAAQLGHAELAFMLCDKLLDSSIPPKLYSQIISSAAWLALEGEHFSLARSFIHKIPALDTNSSPALSEWEDRRVLRLFRLVRDPRYCGEIAGMMGRKWIDLLKESYNLEKMSDDGFTAIINNPALVLQLQKCVELASAESNDISHEVFIQLVKYMPIVTVSEKDLTIFIKEMIRTDDKNVRENLNNMMATPETSRGSDDSLILQDIKRRIKNILEPHVKKNLKSMFHGKPNGITKLLNEIASANSVEKIQAALQAGKTDTKPKYAGLLDDCINILNNEKYKHTGMRTN